MAEFERAASSVAALKQTAQDLVGVLSRRKRTEAGADTLASRAAALQEDYEAHWEAIARAAASLDAAAAAAPGDAASEEMAQLMQERSQLQEVRPPFCHLASGTAQSSARAAARPGGACAGRRAQAADRHAPPTDVRRAANGRL